MASYPFPQPSGELLGMRRRVWPVATLTLMALCFIVFFLEKLAGGSERIRVLLEFGASYGPYTRRGQYWRLVMPMFIHIGWLHILLNMYALWILGPLLERIYGYGRFSVIYVGSGITSAWLSMELSKAVSAGASGAIFGVAGAMLTTGYLHREVVPPRWGRAFGKGMVILILLNLGIGLALPHLIDNWGHVGGLFGGMILAGLIPPPASGYHWMDKKPSQWMVVFPAAVVALAMGATAKHYFEARNVTALLRQGERFREARRDGQAARCFRAAERQDPAQERAYQDLGALYLSEDRPTDALRQYRQALRLDPDSPPVEVALSAAYDAEGNRAQALRWLRKAVGQNSENPQAEAALGDLFDQEGLYSEALQHYRKALELNPNLAEVQNNLAWLLATCPNRSDRNPQKALVHAERAVSLTHWKQPEFIDTLAAAYYANGQYKKAVDTQQKALRLDPTNREMQQHLAQYRQAAGS